MTKANPHLIDGEFQSDKYPTTPRGLVPLSTKDKDAQDLLWTYAQRHRTRDDSFSEAVEEAVKKHGFNGSANWEDSPTPEDDAIDAAMPARTGKHELYAEAMRLVGAKRSEWAFVKLVNWLLAERAEARRLRAALEHVAPCRACHECAARARSALAASEPDDAGPSDKTSDEAKKGAW